MRTLILIFLVAAQEGPYDPKQSLATIKVPDGFRVELVAHEPDVVDPVAMAFDEDGRIFVAEMIDYPLGPPSGRIMLLEDKDGDGRVDAASVYASKVPYPTGVMPWRGGVLVTAAPDILYLKDTDGDGKADVREVLFTGFVEGNQQHRVNGLQFTLDNWIHGTNGDSGGAIRPGKVTDAKKVSISGRDYRFRPDLSGFEAASGHGQFANTFDDWGFRFINDNSNHIRHPVVPLKYLARNPHLAVSAVEDTGVSDHNGAKIFPISKLQERPNDHHAANRFTSACSPTIYRGAALGAEVQGNLFVCEPVHNLVHRDVLVPNGASFTAKRANENAEFIASTDNWFRPVNLCGGPDGALYVVDMYRAIIEHPQWIPLEMQKRVDLRAGHDRGRIYRVLPKEFKPGARPKLSGATGAELATLLEHPNAWWRLTAQRLLIERHDGSAVEALRKVQSPLGRLHALWTLEGLGALTAGEVSAALKHPDVGVRIHALRLAEPRLKELREDVLALAEDADARVRFQLALTIGELADETKVDVLARIARKDAGDRWTRFAILSSLKGMGPQFLERLAGTLEKPTAGVTELVRQLAEVTGASRDEVQVVAWLRQVAANAEPQPARWRLVALSALGPSLRRWGVGLDTLIEKSGTKAVIGGWQARFLETAVDPGREVAERVSAIELLSLLPLPELTAAFEKLLRPQEPQEVQVAAVRAIAAPAGDGAVSRLLDGWLRYTGPVRREVLGACLTRPALMERVVERLEKGEVRVVELEAGQRDALLKHPSGGVRERVRKLLASKNSDEIDKLIEGLFTKVSAVKPDAAAGEKVYMQNCATCHRLHGQGFNVGPSLSSVASRDKRALLTDVLNPNRAIAPQFQVYVVKTPSSDLISGVIATETPTSITLRRANAEDTTVLRRDILEIKAWPASMMPEGLENNLTAQNFADLIEFLQRGPVR